MKSCLPAIVAFFASLSIYSHGQAPHPLVDLTFQPYRDDALWAEYYGQVLVQPDGRILLGVATEAMRPNEKGVLEWIPIHEMRRLHPDGSLDESFLPIPDPGPTVLAPDGDVIALPLPEWGDPARLIRTDRNGRVRWSVVLGMEPHSTSVTVQPDGKILLFGYGGIKRYYANGVEDIGFHFRISPFDGVTSVLALRNGKILASYDVDVNQGGFSHNRIVRLHSDGTEDKTFVTLVSELGRGRSLAILHDGRILAGGGGSRETGDPGLIRLHPDGTPDPTFRAPWYSADRMVVQQDGKIVIGGFFTGERVDGRGNPALLARLHPDGTPDTGFGCPLCDRENEDGQYVASLAIGPDGNVIATGSFFVPATTSWGIVRLKTGSKVPVVQFAVATQDVEETAGRATIRVARTGNTNVTSTVAYVTIGQTATPWRDFVPAMGVLVFRSGETGKSFHVRILSDRRREVTETVALKLFAPSRNSRLGALPASILRIIDSAP